MKAFKQSLTLLLLSIMMLGTAHPVESVKSRGTLEHMLNQTDLLVAYFYQKDDVTKKQPGFKKAYEAMKRTMDDAEDSNPAVRFIKANLARPQLSPLLRRFSIKNLHTIIFFFNNREVGRLTGVATRRQVSTLINQDARVRDHIKKKQEERQRVEQILDEERRDYGRSYDGVGFGIGFGYPWYGYGYPYGYGYYPYGYGFFGHGRHGRGFRRGRGRGVRRGGGRRGGRRGGVRRGGRRGGGMRRGGARRGGGRRGGGRRGGGRRGGGRRR